MSLPFRVCFYSGISFNSGWLQIRDVLLNVFVERGVVCSAGNKILLLAVWLKEITIIACGLVTLSSFSSYSGLFGKGILVQRDC